MKKKLSEMTREELIQEIVDCQAALRSAIKATTPMEKREGANDTLHLMQDAARILKLLFGTEVGFFLMAAPYGTTDGRSNYASTIERETALALMVEFLTKNGKSGDWMKHKL